MKINKDLFNQLLSMAINGIEYMNAKDDDEQKGEWVTIKGNHIFVEEGQTKEDAIKKFIDDKSTGGYSDKKSNRAEAAEVKGLDTISNLAKKLDIKIKDIEGVLTPAEWHHTGKQFKQTNYYYTDAYIDMQKEGKIADKTIDKYDLTKEEISFVKSSWEKLQKQLKSKQTIGKSEDVIKDLKNKYSDNILDEYFDIATSKKKKIGIVAEEIRRSLEWYRSGTITKEKLEENIDFWHKNRLGK